jgi:FAD/FMN-containing dehydrogenase
LTAEAGVVLQTVHEAAEKAGLMFPLDLGARGSCTVGGNISTNAGGNSVIRYGMMREQVLGLEAVLADGTVISSMNTVIKNNTGYDLKQLFIGSGHPGIVTAPYCVAPAAQPQHGWCSGHFASLGVPAVMDTPRRRPAHFSHE